MKRSIYFWRDPKAHLRELRRVPRDDGRLVLGFHTSAAAAAQFPDAVYTLYAAEGVRRLLEACGFTGVRLLSRAGIALAVATASP
jgi:hypothetical protein